MKFFKFFLIFTYILFFQSCISIQGGRQKLYEDFYSAKGSSQYFIKPLSLNTLNKTSKAEIDFTFSLREPLPLTDSAFVNISILDKAIFKQLDSVVFYTSPTSKITIIKPNLLFNEKKGKLILSRFSIKMPTWAVKSAFISQALQIDFFSKENRSYRSVSNKTKKKILKLNTYIFELGKL
jgi:hypothetical protein